MSTPGTGACGVRTGRPWVMPAPHLGAWLADRIRRHGARPALRLLGHEGWNYGELGALVLVLAGHLQASGFRPGDVLAVVSANHPSGFLWELAAIALGGVAAPMNPAWGEAVVRERLGHAGARWVAADTPWGDRHWLPMSGPMLLQRLASVPRPVPLEAIAEMPHAADTPALLLFTSGTTGRPKAVTLTHGNVLHQLSAFEALLPMGPRDRVLAHLPWSHAFGAVVERWLPLHHGAELVLTPHGKDPARLAEDWARVRPTAFFAVPATHRAILDVVEASPALAAAVFHPELRFVFTAAAPLAGPVADRWTRRGVPVATGWGLTECAPSATLSLWGQPFAPGQVGVPMPGVTIHVASDGEVWVRGPNVMAGYWKDPAATAGAIQDGWLRTGDLGAWTPDGLKLLGRKDDRFKLANGRWVHGDGLAETLFGGDPHFAHAVVGGHGEAAPWVLLFPRPALLGPDGPGLAWLEAQARERLQAAAARHPVPYERPNRVAVVPAILSVENGELTASGKLVRRTVLTRHLNPAAMKPLHTPAVPSC